MRLVVADTGPLNYLVLIGADDILPKLFERVVVPEAVCAELRHRRAPASVGAWAARPPAWIEVRPIAAAALEDPAAARSRRRGTGGAGAGTRDRRRPHFDRRSRRGCGRPRFRFCRDRNPGRARPRLAPRRGLIDIGDAVTRLKATNFRYRSEIIDALLAQHRKRGCE